MGSAATFTREEGMMHMGSIVGPEHLRLRGVSIEVAPGVVAQIAEVLRFANAHSLRVTPFGGGTKLDWGNPVEPDVFISMERLRTVREHAWHDMTCTVEAGCPWADMQLELSRHSQMVALDPLRPDRATVGGIVATNDSGALRLKFGGLRDLIIGMTIVLADGTIAKPGGKVVKNVAGYDIHKLMNGSFGTLGVIAEVNFRLHPAEQHARTWTAVVPEGRGADVTLLADPLAKLMNSQMTPSSVQVRSSLRECALDVRIAGVAECLDEYAVRMQDIFRHFSINESNEDVWRARQKLFEVQDALVLKVSVRPGDVCELSSELQRLAAAEGLEISTVAYAHGLMTVSVIPVTDVVIGIIDRLRTKLRKSGGSVVALQVPDAMHGRLDVWGADPGTFTLMREIKHRFDPQRTLNPGRFVGNI